MLLQTSFPLIKAQVYTTKSLLLAQGKLNTKPNGHLTFDNAY